MTCAYNWKILLLELWPSCSYIHHSLGTETGTDKWMCCHLSLWRLSFCSMSCRLSVSCQMSGLSRLCLYWHDRMQQEIPVFLAYCPSRTLYTFPGILNSMAVLVLERMSNDFWRRVIGKPAEPRPAIWTAKRILITWSASLLPICRFIIPASGFIIMIHVSPLTYAACCIYHCLWYQCLLICSKYRWIIAVICVIHHTSSCKVGLPHSDLMTSGPYAHMELPLKIPLCL